MKNAPHAPTKYPAPFSLRLSADEREELLRLANGRPIGAYIKDCIFNKGQRPTPSRQARPVDQKLITQLIGALGQSRIASNINQLAKAANSGSLPVNQEVLNALKEAVDAVHWMRDTLIRALRLKPQSQYQSKRDKGENDDP